MRRAEFLPLALLFAGAAVAQQPASQDVHVLHVRKNIYMLVGAGGNITLSVGPDGVLMVDAGLAQMSGKVIAAIDELAYRLSADGAPSKPIQYIVDTHIHPDHTGGNEAIAKSGKTFTGGNVAGDISGAGEGAAIYAYQTVLTRMSAPQGKTPAAPTAAWPTENLR